MNGRRILIVRLGAMGDVLHALPAVAALRQAYPDVHIGWAIEERWAELLAAKDSRLVERGALKPLVDTVHVVNTKAWRAAMLSDGTWKEARAAVREMQEAKYDVALDFQGSLKSAMVAKLSQAPTRIGFRSPRERVASMFYTRQVMTGARHVIEQNLSLVEALLREDRMTGAVPAAALPVDPAAESWCDRKLRELGLTPGAYAILNPGAGWGTKQWPAARYGEVAAGLAQRGVRSVINTTAAEMQLAAEVEASSGSTAVPVSCSVGELVSLTRRAGVFVGGDTGPTHLAAAMRVPVVALFGPTDPARNGPFGTPSVVIRNAKSITTYKHREGEDPGLMQIASSTVLDAALGLLERRRG